VLDARDVVIASGLGIFALRFMEKPVHCSLLSRAEYLGDRSVMSVAGI
jgi:hypothetical protein